jgi:hypothetical protein
MGNFAGFSKVSLTKPLRSTFDLTHDKRLTTRMGRLTPVFMQECLPSDSFRGSSEMLVRLAPLLAPIYEQINVFVHFFFVPCRLLWEDWEEFITGGRLGVGVDPVTAPVPPFVEVQNVLVADPDYGRASSLLSYLGAPSFQTINSNSAAWDGRDIDFMPALAYQLVWYEYYRDRNFIADTVMSFPFPSGEVTGADIDTYLTLQTRNYEHDYFNSSLPFTQRGEEVLMPVQLGGNAPIYVDPVNGSATDATLSGIENPGSVSTGYGVLLDNAPDPPLPSGSSVFVKGEDFDGTTTTINDFRAAYALQVWLERNAIGGSRYTESTQAHFGVRPQDSRLQRPEYIGGGRIPVKISEVLSTAWSSDQSTNEYPLANMAGHGVTYGNTNQFRYFCPEHGFIIGILSIMNPPSYFTGLPRMFKRRSFLDYPWPTFAKLGEQPVYDFEIYCDPTALLQDADGEFPLWGYQSRYADWKYVCSTNVGDFRNGLIFWTLAYDFGGIPPTLGATFNQFDDASQDRIFAVQGVDSFWIYCHNNCTVKRPLPYFGTPNTMGFN